MAMKENDPLRRFWHLLLIERREITSVYFYAILSGLLQLSVPVGVQAIIGFALGASMVTSIYVLIVIVVIGVLVVGLMQINQMKIIEKIQQRIFTRYAFAFTETLPNIDLRAADAVYLPEKVNRFFDTVNLQKGLAKLLLDIPTAAIQTVFGLLLLALYHPVFILFGLILVLILWLIFRLTGKYGLQTSLKESSYKYALVGWLEEIARTVVSFKFHSGDNLSLHKTDERVTGYLQSRTAHFKVLLIQYKTLLAFKVIVTAVMLTAGTYLLIDQQINIGEFIAAEIVILSVISASEKLIGSLDSVYDVITGLEKLSMVTESEREKEGTVEFQPGNSGTAIELHNVSFQYPDGKKVLQNVSFSVAPNSLVNISGHQGAGKSTLIKLLSGVYNGFTGDILVNGIPIGNYKSHSLRQNIGIYLGLQGVFAGTVWENITLGRKEISFEKIIETAERAGLKDLLRLLPEGLETTIDPSGKRLPSHLIRKILLLRALINCNRLLILEEPFPDDEASKNILLNYLMELRKTTTIVLVSNENNIKDQCDHGIHLMDGTVTSAQS